MSDQLFSAFVLSCRRLPSNSPYLLDHLLDLLLVTVHLRDAGDLGQVDVLAISE